MRQDQFQDIRRMAAFADFSKLFTAKVELDWNSVDLYGLLFSRLLHDRKSSEVFTRLCQQEEIAIQDGNLPNSLKEDEERQEAIFGTIAGAFMGTNKKRGRTYTWLPKHLADAHGETSLRSFLIALREAALQAGDRLDTAVDYKAINAGVQKASDTRREELKEDHPWVEDALDALEGLTVPCLEQEIIDRWRDAKTLERINQRDSLAKPAAPIQLESKDYEPPEKALVVALLDLGVVERRDQERVNVPDIFRVAAKMKRRGGVAPKKRR
jgi:hypothetical protein